MRALLVSTGQEVSGAFEDMRFGGSGLWAGSEAEVFLKPFGADGQSVVPQSCCASFHRSQGLARTAVEKSELQVACWHAIEQLEQRLLRRELVRGGSQGLPVCAEILAGVESAEPVVEVRTGETSAGPGIEVVRPPSSPFRHETLCFTQTVIPDESSTITFGGEQARTIASGSSDAESWETREGSVRTINNDDCYGFPKSAPGLIELPLPGDQGSAERVEKIEATVSSHPLDVSDCDEDQPAAHAEGGGRGFLHSFSLRVFTIPS